MELYDPSKNNLYWWSYLISVPKKRNFLFDFENAYDGEHDPTLTMSIVTDNLQEMADEIKGFCRKVYGLYHILKCSRTKNTTNCR
jgi:hypothetical protein